MNKCKLQLLRDGMSYNAAVLLADWTGKYDWLILHYLSVGSIFYIYIYILKPLKNKIFLL